MRTVGHYRIIEKLGEGGMGEVFLAEDSHLDRRVALKILPTDFVQDPDRVRRFQKEARAASALSHPNILTIYEVGRDGEEHYIAAEYVDGDTLRKRMDAGPLDIDTVVDTGIAVASALAAAHDVSIIHRDVKPENVMIRSDGVVKLTDFGISQMLDVQRLTVTGQLLGSPAYMSPEQINEELPSVQTDIYSLGVVMYELLTGKLPFRAENAITMINKILNEDPVPIQTLRPDLPGKLVEIVARAMHKDPKVRYANWFDMASDLANTFPQLERYSHEISSTEKFNKLRSLPFFREFRDAELWEVLRGAVWENHARDQNLLLEGEIGQAFFIIVAGQVKVVKDGKLLNVLKEGDCFGEMAYLSGDRARRSASIISVSEVQLLKIQASHLDSLSDGCQLRFNREFLRTLIERLTWTSSVLAQFRR